MDDLIPAQYLRKTPAELPQLSEPDVVRHFTHLSKLNYSIDSGFYPLGSCTMKYNPKVNEVTVNQPGWRSIHPYQPEATVQGALHLMYDLQDLLCEIAGMDAYDPAACGRRARRADRVAHDPGVSPFARRRASQRGHRTRLVARHQSGDGLHGRLQADHRPIGRARAASTSTSFKSLVSERTAALMLTNPSTLGLFDEQVLDMSRHRPRCRRAHVLRRRQFECHHGRRAPGRHGLRRRPHQSAQDVHHSARRRRARGRSGRGEADSRAVSAGADRQPAWIEQYFLDYEREHTIGKVRSFYGNFGMLVRAYTYIRRMGSDGLTQVSRDAVLSANYLRARSERSVRRGVSRPKHA